MTHPINKHDKTEFLYNSIFIMLGLAYDWNIDRLADFYGVLPSHFELWLSLMGFDDRTIRRIRERGLHKKGHCFYCGIKTDGLFCSDGCSTAYLSNRRLLAELVDKKEVPNTLYKNTKFNVIKREIIYDKS